MMTLIFNPYALLPFIAGLTALTLGTRGWRYRATPLGKTFLVLMSALTWWSLSVVMEHLSVGLLTKIFWMKMSYFGISAIPGTWLIFTLQYTNRGKWINRRNLAILAVLPLLTLAIVWTNDTYNLMWKDIWLDTSISPAVDAVSHNMWFWIYAAYAYSLIVLGTLCLFGEFRQSSGVYRKQAGTLLLASLIPWLANFLYIVGIGPFSVVDPTPLAFATTGVAFFFGLSRLQLLDIIPIARDAIIRSMIDGVIVLDKLKRIVEINLAALKVIDLERQEAIGKLYDQVLPGYLGLLEFNPEMIGTKALIPLGEGQKQRYYAVNVTTVSTKQHDSGYLIILHDDTERVKSEVEARERVILETELRERNRAHEELEKSEEKYSTIVEKGNDGIIIIQDGAVKFVNSKMTEFTGFSLDETLGKPFLEFISQDFRAFTIDRYKRRIAGESVSNKYEIAILAKNGSIIPVEINANMIEFEGKPADMAMVRDITEHKKSEETLKASEAKFRNLVENAAAGILITLPDGRLVDANKAALEIYGYASVEELKNVSAFSHYANPEDRYRLVNIIQKKGVAKGFEALMARRNGNSFWASINAITQTTESGEKQIIAIVQDITERKNAEVELARLNRELSSFNLQLETKVEERTRQLGEAVIEAKASNQAKSEFLASMSHELRTPLNAIIGFSQVLDAQYFGNLNEKQAEYTKDILESGRHLLSLINDILDLSKVEAGKMELELSTVKVADIVRNSLVMIKEKAQAHRITVEVKIDEEMEHLEMAADERKLKQVMFNLLSNATKFTPDGGRIGVEARIDGGALVISVSDTGIGISAKEQARLFEAFYQASGGIKDKTPGTGLGLKITKSFIEKHGGRIWVESPGTGKGSRFSFTLPIRVVEAAKL